MLSEIKELLCNRGCFAEELSKVDLRKYPNDTFSYHIYDFTGEYYQGYYAAKRGCFGTDKEAFLALMLYDYYMCNGYKITDGPYIWKNNDPNISDEDDWKNSLYQYIIPEYFDMSEINITDIPHINSIPCWECSFEEVSYLECFNPGNDNAYLVLSRENFDWALHLGKQNTFCRYFFVKTDSDYMMTYEAMSG